ncbi:DNRLRE domain-containing protein [Kitasatospora sp. NPDC059673]|uniref:CBM96 family carbohydrate-binding protein n=1 Tax=Kitasatospora sp. NPDC059673 TaxID=3346901 RepID=UPI00369C4A10
MESAYQLGVRPVDAPTGKRLPPAPGKRFPSPRPAPTPLPEASCPACPSGNAGPITASAPCSVLVRESGGTVSISVADPSRTVATVRVTVARPGYVTADPATGVTVLATGPSVQLLAELGGTQSAARTVTLRTSGPAAAANAVLLAPVQDTYVRDGSYADTNYGTATILTVKNTNTSGSGFSRRALFAFDTSQLTGKVRRAVLWVRGVVADSGGTETDLQAFATAPGAWQETAATWNRCPACCPAPGAALGTGRISTAADWVALDVTAAVTADPALTLTVGRPAGRVGLAVNLNSRENAACPPVLQVVTTG